MKFGFYYHTLASKVEEGLKVPGYLGVFLKAIIDEIGPITCFFHSARNEIEKKELDYLLPKDQVNYVDLGPKSTFYKRMIFPGQILNTIKQNSADLDVLLIRAPSPIAPYFNKYVKKVPLAYLIIGDYSESSNYLDQPWWRALVIKAFLRINDKQLSLACKNTLTLVNSKVLFKKYEKKTAHLAEIRTTTLSKKNFFQRTDTCTSNAINLLYTGRYDWAKGFREMIEMMVQLKTNRIDAKLHFVGWEEDPNTPVEKQCLKIAREKEIEDIVLFHGKKKIGPELDAMYRMADIFLIPSYHEGFPRVIWEAMANSLPVIATKVGAIPFTLRDQKDALLIAPQDSNQLTAAVVQLISSSPLRKQLIKSGYQLATQNTLENQTATMLNIVSTHLNNFHQTEN